MGHADIRTTLNVYAKAVPGWEQGATAKMDAYLDGTGSRDTGATTGPESVTRRRARPLVSRGRDRWVARIAASGFSGPVAT